MTTPRNGKNGKKDNRTGTRSFKQVQGTRKASTTRKKNSK